MNREITARDPIGSPGTGHQGIGTTDRYRQARVDIRIGVGITIGVDHGREEDLMIRETTEEVRTHIPRATATSPNHLPGKGMGAVMRTEVGQEILKEVEKGGRVIIVAEKDI